MTDENSSRQIPIPEPVEINFVSRVKIEPLNAKDQSALRSLIEELVDAGVIERYNEGYDSQTPEELQNIIEDALSRSKSEKELNPKFYDAELDESLGGDLAVEDDWENPLLDNLDDYGNQIYDNMAENDQDIEDDGVQYAKVRLADGTVVFAEIVNLDE